MTETFLDWLVLLGLLPALVVSVPLALYGNGKRPLAVLVLVMIGIFLWAGIEGLSIENSMAHYIRLSLGDVVLFICPLWAAIVGRRALKASPS